MFNNHKHQVFINYFALKKRFQLYKNDLIIESMICYYFMFYCLDGTSQNVQVSRGIDNQSQNNHLQSHITQDLNQEHQAAPPPPLYNSQHRVIQHQTQPTNMNSNIINESNLISNQTRRAMIHQQQLQFAASNAPIQSSQSSSDASNSALGAQQQHQLQHVSNPIIVHSGSIPQRIFIQHQSDNINSQTTSHQTVPNSHIQQVRQQQHYVSISGNQQIHTQQLPTHLSIQQPHQILISGNNSNQVLYFINKGFGVKNMHHANLVYRFFKP